MAVKRCSIIKGFRRNKYLFLTEGGGKSGDKTLSGSKLPNMLKSTHLQKLFLTKLV